MIGVRAARDHSPLRPVPGRPYIVADRFLRHMRHMAMDCLVAFDANVHSVPAVKVRHRQLVEVRASAATVSLHSTVPDAQGNGRIVNEAYGKGLPDGHTRATTTDPGYPQPSRLAGRHRIRRAGLAVGWGQSRPGPIVSSTPARSSRSTAPATG